MRQGAGETVAARRAIAARRPPPSRLEVEAGPHDQGGGPPRRDAARVGGVRYALQVGFEPGVPGGGHVPLEDQSGVEAERCQDAGRREADRVEQASRDARAERDAVVERVAPRQRVVTAVLAGRLGHWSLPASIASLLHPVDSAGAAAALERLDIADRLFARCSQLSGGQLQRVGIARAVIHQPDYLFYDEPTAGLDPLTAERIDELIATLGQQTGTTSIVVTHDMASIARNADRVLLLHEASAAFLGSRANFLASDLPLIRQFLARGH